MNKLIVALAVCSLGTAYAQSGKSAAPSGKSAAPSGGSAAPAGGMEMMTPPKPGPEQDALKPLVRSGSGTGTRMMPDGKEAQTKIKTSCKWMAGNMWAACDIEQTIGAAKPAMKWMGHLVFGYDTMAKGYRGGMTDNMGMMSRMKGTLDGQKMTWESMDEMKGPPGMPSKERVTEDFSDGKTDKLTFEGMMGGKWTPMGKAEIKFAGK